jgi:uncharacterized alkaline shock family protein YloU
VKPNADVIADAVTGVPSVARLVGGGFPEVATYLPGRRVIGVRVADDGVQVHVAARYGVELPELDRQIRAAVGPVAMGLPVSVFIDDIDVPEPA